MDDARRLAQQRRMIERGREHYRLTVGELFPDGDLVGQWVFSLTTLTEDIQVLIRPLDGALAGEDLRSSMFYGRQLVTRLYEARRLVWAVRDLPEVNAFAGRLIASPPGGLDLNSVYLRDPPDKASVVEDLYAEQRHRTVHYMHVGEPELRDVLWKHSGYPAQMVIDSSSATPDIWCKWVHAVTAADVVGDVAQPDFLEQMKRRGEMSAKIASAWTIIAGIAVPLHVRRLGLDLESVIEVIGGPGSS